MLELVRRRVFRWVPRNEDDHDDKDKVIWSLERRWLEGRVEDMLQHSSQ